MNSKQALITFKDHIAPALQNGIVTQNDRISVRDGDFANEGRDAPPVLVAIVNLGVRECSEIDVIAVASRISRVSVNSPDFRLTISVGLSFIETVTSTPFVRKTGVDGM